MFKVVTEPFVLVKLHGGYIDTLYENPFTGDESWQEIMKILCDFANGNVCSVEDNVYYMYACATFEEYMFPQLNIKYMYKTEEDWAYGVPREVVYEEVKAS